ncbi:MAG: FtsH protease activity modulator HflK [Magnetovibrionaceae bacterium]
MAWNPQGGGQGPWGRGPQGGGGGGFGGGGGGGGPQPPDIEDLLRKSQDRVKKFMPGGFGGGKVLFLGLLVVALFWLGSGFYRVQPGEVGLRLLFGEYKSFTGPGLNYWLPAPLGNVIKVNVEVTNQLTVGFRGDADGRRSGTSGDVPEESLMLTGDQNIVDLDFVVQWRISDASFFLFNISNPQDTLKRAAESAMREVVGQLTLEEVLVAKRGQVQTDMAALLQQILDDYGSGIFVDSVRLQKIDPPQEVIDAFNDVQRARQDQERAINEATAYLNDVVPRAKGEAERMIQAATAEKEKLQQEAVGEAQRFLSVYEAYLVDKDVTKRRLFLERMQQVFKDVDKVILDNGASGSGGSGVVPYLPLNELRRGSQAQGGTQ